MKKFDIKNYKNLKEFARDFFALGSWIFYILVIGRALIKPYRPFADEIIIAAVGLLIITVFIKNYDGYSSRALILVIFTTLFYQSKIFSIFAVLVFIGLLISSYFIGNTKAKIIKGLIIGVICSLLGYYLAGFSINV